MLCDVVVRRRRRRRWAHAPVIHAASHFDQKKRVAWVPISMQNIDCTLIRTADMTKTKCIRVVPFSIIMGLRLAALRAVGAPLKKWGVTDFVLEITCPEEHLNLSKSYFVSEEDHSVCKSQTIAIRALRGNVLYQIWFKWTY